MRRLMLLMLCLLLLTGCSHNPIEPLATAQDVPAPAVENMPVTETQAVLWFRYGDEPYLAPEVREISATSAQNRVLNILRALVAGPGVASTELRGLFPNGTQVISVTQSGRILFVTLSRQIMNSYPDEPANWRDQAAWAIEVPLRRQLAMQSIVATATECCDVDSVIILVDQSATDSLRLRQSYYTLDGDSTLAEPLRRDESLLLTPTRTAEVILQCWQASDWQRLYRYVAKTDPATGLARPDEAEFAAQMAEQPHLLTFSAAGGSSLGSSVLFTVEGEFLSGGAAQPFTGMTLRLTLEKGIWRVGLSQLTEREAMP